VTNANDIAEWFVRYSASELGAPVDPMSLEKLIYYAQAFHLARDGEPLFPDEIRAWKLGPVIPGVYHKYSDYGANPIVLPDGKLPPVGADLGVFLSEVVGFFCRYTAIGLSRATHLENPWMDANASDSDLISQSSMKVFYRSLIDDGENALSRCELLDSVSDPRWGSLYVAGICWRKITNHPFYDSVLANQLADTRHDERPPLPESFFAPARGRNFIEFTPDEDVDETIQRAIS
jgi:uncharacterized phage-associated protein